MKPKREITLGEMQDECSFRGGNCQTISCATVGGDMCVHYKICGKIGKPIDWDLSDPPRFNEAQMAFLRGCYGIGIIGLLRNSDGVRTHFMTKFGSEGYIMNADYSLKVGETLDLAQLFGKEGEK